VDYYRQALAVRREAGDAWGEAETLSDLGDALRRAGQPDEARDCWQRALAMFEDFGHPRVDEVRAHLRELDLAS
jgi:tetratricopeptide (TPR) repeat protein